MNKFRKGILLTVSVAAVSILIPLVATALQGGNVLKANHLQIAQTERVKTEERTPSRKAVSGTPYWQTAKSIYNEDMQIDLQNGATRKFGTHVEIDGDVARIYGLVDLHEQDYYEIDEEFYVEGVYDDRHGTITISGTDYNQSRPLSEYKQLAKIYSPANDMSYTVCLIAGFADNNGNVNTFNELVFNVSDDLSTISTQMSGFGAYAFADNGKGNAFIDFYQSSSLVKCGEEANIGVNIESLSFPGQFVAVGMPVSQSFSLYNSGAAAADFTVSTSSPLLTVAPSGGTIDGCSKIPLTVTISPEEIGEFNGTVTVAGCGQTIDIPVAANVFEMPDYTRIVKAGSEAIAFDMSPMYPFIISDIDDRTAAVSTNSGAGENTDSWFKCTVEVPQGKTGVFSWKAIMEDARPSSLIVFLDGERIMYNMQRPYIDPFDMSGKICLTEGKHEIMYDHYIHFDELPQRAYVWDLDFELLETVADNATLEFDSVDFGETYYDNLPVPMKQEITLINLGTNPLKVLSVESDGNFSGTVPEMTAPRAGEIKVPLLWNASGVGVDNGVVTIHTTGGDLQVNCTGKGTALPYDYSQLVTEGEFSFNTDIEWPFVVSDNGNYVYNSTSKADILGLKYSWIEASFEVPEGKVGHLQWDAINSSQEVNVFSGIPYVVSGTIITIDGEKEVSRGGQNADCKSSVLYSPIDLTFPAGQHTVKFNYKKTSNIPSFVYGDDRLKLFEIGLTLNDLDDEQGVLTNTVFEYANDVIVGTTGHIYTTLHNFTQKVPEFLSYECDGPFTAKCLGEKNGELEFVVEFKPVSEGYYSSDLTFKTNIGDYTVACSGNAVKSEFGTPLFYESFEYETSGWLMFDAAGEGNYWTPVNEEIPADLRELEPYDGRGTMYVSYKNPVTNEYFDVVDTYATTSEITIPEDGETTLHLMVKGFNYNGQNFDILAGEGNDPLAYTPVGKISLSYDDLDWRAYTFDLSAWRGKTIRISFHANDMVGLYFALDDILVATTGTSGVGGIEADSAVEYYTIDGLRHDKPVKGVNIVVRHNADGSVSTHKEMFE